MSFLKNNLSKIYNLDPVDIGGQSQWFLMICF